MSASSLQSPDDMEATYREESKKFYKGYVTNLTETCDPDNPLQFITKVQVASNHTEDADLLVEALPNLKERTVLDTLYTDGGYGSPDADQTLHDNRVEQIQTAIHGRVPSTEKLNLADFEIKQTQSDTPTQITCPGNKAWRFSRAAIKKVLWLTLRRSSVRSVLSYRNVLPKEENGIRDGLCASIRSKSMSPSVGGRA